MKILKNLRGVFLATVAASLTLPGIAQAQAVNSVNPNATAQLPMSAPSQASSGSGVAFIGDLATGSAANVSNISRYTPAVTEAYYKEHYPNAGQAGWDRARKTTEDLCAEANGIMADLYLSAGRLNRTDLTYDDLGKLYDGMPKKLKRHAAVMTVGQAASTGALCLLSAGLYCIAAAAGGVGNIVGIQGNLKMQLANVKLSQANIYATNTNTMLARTNVRATSMWVKFAFPACQYYGMNQVARDWTLDVPPAPADGR